MHRKARRSFASVSLLAAFVVSLCECNRFLQAALPLEALQSGQEKQGQQRSNRRPGRQNSTFPGRRPSGTSVTVQQPVFGIAIDAQGVLSRKVIVDQGAQLFRKRIAAARATLPPNVQRQSNLRKVSLVRLEKAIRKKLDAGEEPDEVMKHLAGLIRLKYVFVYPEEKDIVIAGPAEGWFRNPTGRAVGLTSAKPVLLLDDMLVALRVFRPGQPINKFLGCSIGPTRQGMIDLREFSKKIPKVISQRDASRVGDQIRRGVVNALGMTNVSVIGLPSSSHFARVLVEADYRMKLIGIGLEPAPIKMRTFASELSYARHGIYHRWWFLPHYRAVKVAEDRLAMELIGQGVKLSAQRWIFDGKGRFRIDGNGKPPRPSKLFTQDFTQKYDRISLYRPVFAELKNLIDMLIATAFINKMGYHQLVDWKMSLLSDRELLPLEVHTVPKQVPAAVNGFWKRSRFFAPVGGVGIAPAEALTPKNLLGNSSKEVAEAKNQVDYNSDEKHWWWD